MGGHPPPPEQTKVTIVGKNAIYHWTNCRQVSFGTQNFGSQTPPPPPSNTSLGVSPTTRVLPPLPPPPPPPHTLHTVCLRAEHVLP